jgi:hypothetical protein
MTMTEITHGFVSGLTWSVILGTFLVTTATILSRMLRHESRTHHREVCSTGLCQEAGGCHRFEASRFMNPTTRTDATRSAGPIDAELCRHEVLSSPDDEACVDVMTDHRKCLRELCR